MKGLRKVTNSLSTNYIIYNLGCLPCLSSYSSNSSGVIAKLPSPYETQFPYFQINDKILYTFEDQTG